MSTEKNMMMGNNRLSIEGGQFAQKKTWDDGRSTFHCNTCGGIMFADEKSLEHEEKGCYS